MCLGIFSHTKPCVSFDILLVIVFKQTQAFIFHPKTVIQICVYAFQVFESQVKQK